MGVARRANIKNQQLTTASTFHYVEAVALYNTLNTTKQKKEEYKEVISLLKRGYSVRNTAKLSNVSVSTVQRVKREFSL